MCVEAFWGHVFIKCCYLKKRCHGYALKVYVSVRVHVHIEKLYAHVEHNANKTK